MWHNRDLNQRKCWRPGCQKWQLEVDNSLFQCSDSTSLYSGISKGIQIIFHCLRQKCSIKQDIKFPVAIHDVSNGQIWNLGYWNVWVKMTCWAITRQNFQEVQHVLPVCLVWHEKSFAKCYLWTEWRHITKNKPGLNWNVTLNPG